MTEITDKDKEVLKIWLKDPVTNESTPVSITLNELETGPQAFLKKIEATMKNPPQQKEGSANLVIYGENKQCISVPITKEDSPETIKKKMEDAYLELKRRSTTTED